MREGEPKGACLRHVLADAGGHIPVGLRRDEAVPPLAAGARIDDHVGLADGAGRAFWEMLAPAAQGGGAFQQRL